MKIKVKIQRYLAVAHLSEDSGDWVFTICRRGLEKLVNKRLKVGESYIIDIVGILTIEHGKEGVK